MKSNEEFIAGIYQKAELLRQQEDTKEAKAKIVPIHSYSHRIRKFSAYAAGVAACFLFGVSVVNDDSVNLQEEAMPAREARDIELASSRQQTEPAVIAMEEDQTKENQNQKMIQAVVVDAVQEDGIGTITIQTLEAFDQNQNTYVFTIAQNELAIWQKSGTEIVISVCDTGQGNSIQMVPDSVVYTYQSTKDGQKIYAAPDGSVITVSEIH